MSDEELKQLVLDTVTDLVSNFLYYDRKGDEELTLKKLDKAFAGNIITPAEVAEKFKVELTKHCGKLR